MQQGIAFYAFLFYINLLFIPAFLCILYFSLKFYYYRLMLLLWKHYVHFY